MRVLSFLLLIAFLSSCTNQIKENQELRNELRSRELELSSIQGSPGYKIGQALEYFYNEDFPEAIKIMNDLEKSFPEWNKEIVTIIRNKIEAKLKESKS